MESRSFRRCGQIKSSCNVQACRGGGRNSSKCMYSCSVDLAGFKHLWPLLRTSKPFKEQRLMQNSWMWASRMQLNVTVSDSGKALDVAWTQLQLSRTNVNENANTFSSLSKSKGAGMSFYWQGRPQMTNSASESSESKSRTRRQKESWKQQLPSSSPATTWQRKMSSY